MKIMISPAKKMNVADDLMSIDQRPCFEKERDIIYENLKTLSLAQLKELWACNDKIALLNYERIKQMEQTPAITPALLSYEGIQYQYMAPAVFSDEQWQYVQQHLRILSGFYGVLKPKDPIVPYRLEMQARLKIGAYKDLYEFWADKIYREIRDQDGIILNLASKEYSKAVEKYLTSEDTLITCVFGEWDGRKVKVKATQAKMARGEMVRWMAKHQITELSELKQFNCLDYQYLEELSDPQTYVFIKQQKRIQG